jgi:hypothetical protein
MSGEREEGIRLEDNVPGYKGRYNVGNEIPKPQILREGIGYRKINK